MPAPFPTSPSSTDLDSDERREWMRIEDNLLLEYRLTSDPVELPPPGLPAVTQEMIAAAVGKPTSDLLTRSGDILIGSPILPWIRKVDWLLEVMLKAMSTLHPESMAIARVTTVNISGGGISFVSSRQFSAGDRLAMKIILPPFTPIQTNARVIRATPQAGGQGFTIATQFQELSADDQEHIIRYVIQAQAERLRARRQTG